jgi:hypothetical protein
MIENYLPVAYYLDGLSECYFTDISTIDDGRKTVLVLRLQSDPYNIRCIEVKTPEEEGDYCSSYLRIAGKTIIPSVVRYKDHPVKRLKQLHRVTGIPYVSIIHDLVELAHCSQGITIMASAFDNTSTLIALGLAKYVNQGRDIRFMDSPPNL